MASRKGKNIYGLDLNDPFNLKNSKPFGGLNPDPFNIKNSKPFGDLDTNLLNLPCSNPLKLPSNKQNKTNKKMPQSSKKTTNSTVIHVTGNNSKININSLDNSKNLIEHTKKKPR
jgi:hypothetical protein